MFCIFYLQDDLVAVHSGCLLGNKNTTLLQVRIYIKFCVCRTFSDFILVRAEPLRDIVQPVLFPPRGKPRREPLTCADHEILFWVFYLFLNFLFVSQACQHRPQETKSFKSMDIEVFVGGA